MKVRRRTVATAVALSAALAGTVTAAVLLAACTGSSGPSGHERASALCAKTAGTASHVVASFATTVGEVRSWKAGPGQQPAAAAWGGYSAGDFAAWCWLGTSGNSGNVVATSGGKPAITFATGDFAAMPPSPNGPAVP
jgi:hypothetical protein